MDTPFSFLALAPLGLTVPIVSVLLGFAFGFTLERSGFGDSRRLAAQFYLTEMRVLKVMFTAIVTCLLLITAASSLGWMDFGALAINPTYITTALLGGLLLGMGFIIGGYCPGTSIVSAATFKVDGMFFVGGVAAGVFAFGEIGGSFRTFYDNAGYLGRLTLPEALGMPFGVVVALIVVMAAFMFWGGTVLERRFGRDLREPPTRTSRPFHRFLRPAGVLFLAVAAIVLARPVAGAGSIEQRMTRLEPELQRTLRTRAVHVDPVELLGLMHGEIGGRLGRFHLVLLDLRSESDFNRFHLLDARRTTLAALRGDEGRTLAGPRHDQSIVVVMSNDEARATEAWKTLRAHDARNAYVLAGGVNLWLDVFRLGRMEAQAATPPVADERLRHDFPSSLGARYPFARPSTALYRRWMKGTRRAFEPRVRPITKAITESAGCG